MYEGERAIQVFIIQQCSNLWINPTDLYLGKILAGGHPPPERGSYTWRASPHIPNHHQENLSIEWTLCYMCICRYLHISTRSKRGSMYRTLSLFLFQRVAIVNTKSILHTTRKTPYKYVQVDIISRNMYMNKNEGGQSSQLTNQSYNILCTRNMVYMYMCLLDTTSGNPL